MTDSPYIVAWTNTQRFFKDKEETIEVFTPVNYFIKSLRINGGYDFKIQNDDRLLWIYYDTFIVKNTEKNVELIKEVLKLREEMDVKQIRVSQIFNILKSENIEL